MTCESTTRRDVRASTVARGDKSRRRARRALRIVDQKLSVVLTKRFAGDAVAIPIDGVELAFTQVRDCFLARAHLPAERLAATLGRDGVRAGISPGASPDPWRAGRIPGPQSFARTSRVVFQLDRRDPREGPRAQPLPRFRRVDRSPARRCRQCERRPGFRKSRRRCCPRPLFGPRARPLRARPRSARRPSRTGSSESSS